MICLRNRTRSMETMTVAVVDPRPGDYAALLRAVNRPGMKWRFLTTGRQALRLARTARVDLWVVNTRLPDFSGTDLCQMLRVRSPPPVLYVVADEYRADDERAARLCGALLFDCKPPEARWFLSTVASPW
jgi:DNA-binding response OmpR family regulator